MFCSYCGHENSDNSQFCANCGKKLRTLDTNAVEEEPAAEESVSAEETVSEEDHAVTENLVSEEDNTVTEESVEEAEQVEEAEEITEPKPEKKPLKKKKKKRNRIFVIGILVLIAAVGVSMLAKVLLPSSSNTTATTEESSASEEAAETPVPSESAEPEVIEATSAEEVIEQYIQTNDSNVSKKFNFLFTFHFPYNDNGTPVNCTFTDSFDLKEDQYNEYSYATGSYRYYQVLDDGRVVGDTESQYDQYYVLDPETEYVKLGDGEWVKYTDMSGGLFSSKDITENLKEAEWDGFSVTDDTYVLTSKFKYFREACLGDYLDNYAEGFTDYDKVIEDFDNGTIEFTFEKDTYRYLGMKIYDTTHSETWDTGEATYSLECTEEVTGYDSVKEEDVKVPQSVIDEAVDAEE